MPEHIIPVNMLEQHITDYTDYIIYILRHRVLPSPIDGLKPVHRRILFSLFKDFHMRDYNSHTIKTSRVSGHVIGKYHPHSQASVDDAIKPMVNWFESYMPSIRAQGCFGSMYGDKQSAARYTEIALSNYALDCIISDLRYTNTATDWCNNYDNSCLEPLHFPSALPNLLINGTNSIGVGMITSLPKHNISEVINETIKHIKNPNHKIFLIPDNCTGSDIIATDFKQICRTGKGKYRVRGRLEICEYDYGKGGKYPALKVVSMPDLVFFNNVKAQLEKLVKGGKLPQIYDILNDSKIDKKTKIESFEVYIVLRKDADPNYMREMIYNTTSMESTVVVDFEAIYNNKPVLLSYTDYIDIFLQSRREVKYRVYSSKLQEAKTNIHKYQLYIRAMKTGKIKEIQSLVYNQKKIDDEYVIGVFTKKLGVTPLQAKFLLDLGFKKLSLGYLAKYEEELKKETELAKLYFHKITHIEDLDKEIQDELAQLNKIYGCPRRSRVITREEATAIPKGMFKVVITNNNCIKKASMDEKVSIKGNDSDRLIIPIDNTDTIVIFSTTGRVFQFPVHKIPFSKRTMPGVSINSLIPAFTSDIVYAVPKSKIEYMMTDPNYKNYIYTISKDSYLKRMDLDDFVDVPTTKGLVYSKLDEGDIIKDIVFMPAELELLIFSHNKALRISGEDAPYIRRTTKGYCGMRTKYDIGGMECIPPDATHIVVVTNNMHVNKLQLQTAFVSTRGKSGTAVIKLGKTDSIARIVVCKNDSILSFENTDGATKDIVVSDIPDGSSISTGVKILSGKYKDVARI